MCWARQEILESWHLFPGPILLKALFWIFAFKRSFGISSCVAKHIHWYLMLQSGFKWNDIQVCMTSFIGIIVVSFGRKSPQCFGCYGRYCILFRDLNIALYGWDSSQVMHGAITSQQAGWTEYLQKMDWLTDTDAANSKSLSALSYGDNCMAISLS